MGGGLSSTHSQDHIGRSEKEIVALMMPIYYIGNEVSDADIEVAKNNWQMIIDNTATPFLEVNKVNSEKGFQAPYQCSSTFFTYDYLIFIR